MYIHICILSYDDRDVRDVNVNIISKIVINIIMIHLRIYTHHPQHNHHQQESGRQRSDKERHQWLDTSLLSILWSNQKLPLSVHNFNE